MEALLVDEPTYHQHEPLVRCGEPGTKRFQVIGDGLQVARIDRIRDCRYPPGRDAEYGRNVAAHELGAGDHPVGAADHRALDAVDVRLRVVLHPTLVATELRRVDGHEPGAADRAREALGGAGDQPVVRVHEVEVEPFAQL